MENREMFRIRPARSEDLAQALELLLALGLHGEGVRDCFPDGYVVAEYRDEMVGVCGIEVYGAFGLLRSAAVLRKWQGKSAGRALVENRISLARSHGMRALYLITIDADSFFERFGFRCLRREDVPPEIKGSLEFSSLCPDSAIVMVKWLGAEGETGRG